MMSTRASDQVRRRNSGAGGTAGQGPPSAGRILGAAYGTAVYVAFLALLVYTVAFLADVVVPRTIDSGGPSSTTTAAVIIDLVLLGLFGLQHSVMARPGFKRRWTRVVPNSVERSTYVLASTAVLALLYWQWRPIDSVIWDIDGAGAVLLWALYVFGWAITVSSTFLIDHFELFGLSQVFRNWSGRSLPDEEFRTPLLYRLVRHPLMVGFLISFWATPHMTAGHVLFAAVGSTYIVVAVRFEERDLVASMPEYRDYMRTTPRFVPGTRPRHAR